MNFSFHSPLNDLRDKAINHMQALNYQLPNDCFEGFGFLDHALRIKDKPLMLTEECVAAGCRDDLL